MFFCVHALSVFLTVYGHIKPRAADHAPGVYLFVRAVSCVVRLFWRFFPATARFFGCAVGSNQFPGLEMSGGVRSDTPWGIYAHGVGRGLIPNFPQKKRSPIAL